MVGAGTVGGGVYEIIMGRLDRTNLGPTSPYLRECIIDKICVRDLSKPRTFAISHRTSVTTDLRSIIDDEGIDMVVEVMGGTGLAKTVVMESLKRGKSVVSANKALIAECLDEINDIVIKSEGKAQFAYEAAVCGGIPIIQVLQGCYSGDQLRRITGICNGTTNFMLGKMEEGVGYAQVLKEAQDLGYAEADPTADVEGYDVRAKIAIMAKLAFGRTIPISKIPCIGITKILPIDFDYAALLDSTIKIVGTAERIAATDTLNESLSVYVAPKIVSKSDPLASARGSGNIVAIESVNLGTTSYSGPGAGRYPTANSVVADIDRVASGNAYKSPFPLVSEIRINSDYSAPFYIRVFLRSTLSLKAVQKRVEEIAESNGLKINAMLKRNDIKNKKEITDFVVTTVECKESQVMGMCEDIRKEDFVQSTPFYMPLLETKA